MPLAAPADDEGRLAPKFSERVARLAPARGPWRGVKRALQPGAPVVFVTPNVSNLSVGAHTFWMDPSHLRPIPPDLFKFYLEVEGFKRVEIRTFEPSEERLNEDVSDPKIRANVKLLNTTLFGDRDYAVVGCQPWA